MLLRRAIANNTLYNAAGRVWEFAASLILLRLAVEYIGVSQLGLWALVAPFIGYMALLDLGIGSGFARYVAEHAARDEEDKLSAVVSTGFHYYFLFGVVLVLMLWPLAGVGMQLVDRLATLSPGAHDDLLFLLRGGVVLFALSNCFTAFTAVQTGLQRMGVTNAISAVSAVIKLGATAALLMAEHGVRALLYGELVSTVFFGICSVAAAFLLRPGLRVSPRRASASTFRALFGFGWRAQVARLSNLVMFQTDKIIVGAYYSIAGAPGLASAQIGFYELGVNMANKLRQGPAVLTSALLPAASHLHARDEGGRLRELYVRATKYLAFVAIPLAVFTAAAAELILHTWLGPGFERSAWVLRIIAIGYVANIVPGAGVSIVLGQGDSGRIMWAGIVSMTSNIVLTVGLVLTIGFWGIPIATSLSMFISWAWFAHAVRKELGLGFGVLLRRTCLGPLLLALPAAAPVVVLDYVSAGYAGFLWQAAFLCSGLAAFILVYAGGCMIKPLLDGEDVALFETALPLDRVPGARRLLRSMARV